MKSTRLTMRNVAAAALAALALAACGGGGTYQGAPEAETANRDTIFAKGGVGLQLFGTDNEGTGGAVAVNAFLWRASLDTVGFLPLVSADPFGGVIITDWYSPPETPDERFKVNVYILGRTLRADGLRISIFRQTRAGAGMWNDAAVSAEMATEFENAVLTRARDLRLRAVAEKE